MDITRDIVLDLLPLYLAGEASADSTTAVRLFLEGDPGLARMVQEEGIPRLRGAPRPISKEIEMEAYRKATVMMTIRTIAVAVVIAGTLLSLC